MPPLYFSYTAFRTANPVNKLLTETHREGDEDDGRYVKDSHEQLET